MSPLDLDLLAERTMAVERHLARVAERLPADASAFRAASDASDAVVLHLWQATQITIDMAMAACLQFSLGTPTDYGDGFRRLYAAGVIDEELAARLVRAAGFRNLVAHMYDTLDMARVHRTAQSGPPDLRAFLAALRDALATR